MSTVKFFHFCSNFSWISPLYSSDSETSSPAHTFMNFCRWVISSEIPTKSYRKTHEFISHFSVANAKIIDGNTQTVYTTSDKGTTHFMSPIGSLQLTAEECNEILMKRAVAAVQAGNQHTITTTSSSDQHNARKYLNVLERIFWLFIEIL